LTIATALPAAVVVSALLVSLGAAEVYAAPSPPPRSIANGPLTLVPAGRDGTIFVEGLHSYFGALEVEAHADGLALTNRIPLERYLLGLQEVPLGWPREALRAQAVAARTYVLWGLARPPAGAAGVYGFDICASDECQVFSGADVAAQPDGAAWKDAVASTRGVAVLYAGEPILARYHSTSGGRTFDNALVFEDEPAYPYLRSVRSDTEGASPLYRWEVVFRLPDLQRMLERAGWWTRQDGRLKEVSTSRDARLYDPDVVLRGGGRTTGGARAAAKRYSAGDLRELLGRLAPRLRPALYPSPAPTVSGRLPETLPSERFEVATGDGMVLVRGSGWGHGVGLSQWGAYGLASNGGSYESILEHYYTGTTVGPAPELGEVEVGLDWGRDSYRVEGSFDIVGERGQTVVKGATKVWSLSLSAQGGITVRDHKGVVLEGAEPGPPRSPAKAGPLDPASGRGGAGGDGAPAVLLAVVAACLATVALFVVADRMGSWPRRRR